MPSPFETELAASRADFRSERRLPVQYQHKAGGDPLSINAVPANSRRGTVDEFGGAVLTAGSAEWLIMAADLNSEPERGDKLAVDRGNGKTEHYVATPPDEERHVWDWHDNGHTEYRVFFKRDRTEDT